MKKIIRRFAPQTILAVLLVLFAVAAVTAWAAGNNNSNTKNEIELNFSTKIQLTTYVDGAWSDALSDDYGFGDTATLTAPEKSGSKNFSHWEADGSIISYSNPLKLTMNAHTTLYAVYADAAETAKPVSGFTSITRTNEGNKISFQAIAGGGTVQGVGIVYSTTASGETLKIGGTGVTDVAAVKSADLGNTLPDSVLDDNNCWMLQITPADDSTVYHARTYVTIGGATTYGDVKNVKLSDLESGISLVADPDGLHPDENGSDTDIASLLAKDGVKMYTVNFDANGGTGTMAPQAVLSGKATALNTNTFTREGYTFSGWNTNQNGGGTTYMDGQSVTFSADTTLYAQWNKSGGTTPGGSSGTSTEPSAPGGSSGTSTGPSTPGGSSDTPTGPSSPGAEAYTVPVTNENTVNISVNITDGNAVIQEITQADLDKITDDTFGSGTGKGVDDTTIAIDVSGAKSEVTSVELSGTSIEKIAKTVEASERINSVEIKMTNATVELDGAAISAISGQMERNKIKLVVENKEQAKLNVTQKEALKKFTSVQPFQAYFESGGKEIHDFKGGKATVSIKFTPETGKDVKHYHMYYVPSNGLIERYVTRYLNGMLTFVTTHFSDYAIVYDETMENETGKEDTTPSPTETPTTPGSSTTPTEKPTTPTETPTTPTGTDTPVVSDKEKTTAALSLNAGLKVIHKGKTATVQWGKVSRADFYRVYAGYCGGKASLVKTVKSGAKCKVTIKKLNGKKLSTTKNIKVYVAAYRKAKVSSGSGTVVKNVRIAKTITGHVVGKNNKKYSNAKTIKLSKTSYTLKKGMKAQIKAKTVLQYPKKKQLGDGHAKEFRYATSNKSIATVSKTGKITAKKKGSCVIYVYARNGLTKKVKVTVQ